MSPRGWDTLAAAGAFALLTLVLTWPLARSLGSELPADLGDPLLNSWILAWDAEHLLRAATGHLGALREYWHANIFYPHPLALAYSEHLTAQAVMILPVYAITRNPILVYNLAFLATFVLSALGMFLFVRELTGSRSAAFLAGVAYGFAPYRFGTLSHLQVLSSMWMPFAWLGFHRYVETRRLAPLAGGTLAWIAQNLSCGYYLLFFTPAMGIFLAWELTRRRLWADRQVWRHLLIAAAAVAVATVPFLMPYLELRRLGFSPRSLGETGRFSSDVYGYLTTDVRMALWGRLVRAWPKSEGSLFPGFTIVLLACLAIGERWRQARRASHRQPSSMTARVIAAALLVSCGVLIALLLGWTLRLTGGAVSIKITSLPRVVILAAGLAAALAAVSPRARATARSWFASPVGMLALVTIFAFAMSLGPQIHARGQLVEARNVYAPFYAYVPGFDGLRVPARFAMVVALGLAGLAGHGAAVIGSPARRGGRCGAHGADRRRIVVGPAAAQRELHRLQTEWPGAAPRHAGHRIGRARRVSLRRAIAAVERADRNAVRRDRVRNAVHVLFNDSLAASRQRLQRRRPRPVRALGRTAERCARSSGARLARRHRVDAPPT